MIFEEDARPLDLCVEEDVDDWKCRRLEFILVVKLLDCRVISPGIVCRFPVYVYAPMHIEVAVEEYVRIRELRIDEQLRHTDGVVGIFDQQVV